MTGCGHTSPAAAQPDHHRVVPVRPSATPHITPTAQQPAWHKRYAVGSGIEGTTCEFANGHGMRRCRCRGQAKAHLQHVLTAVAVTIERLSRQSRGENTPPRSATALPNHLDQQGIQRLRSWRAVS